MIQIILGSFLLSITHALIPNHWIPLVVLSKTEKWNRFETAKITAIAGISHTLSTILIGFLIGLLGYKLNELFNTIGSLYAPIVLTLLGLVYVYLDYRNNWGKKKDGHHHHEHLEIEKIKAGKKKSNLALIISLSTAMFFSPCVEIEAYYFNAGTYGWSGIIILSFFYFFVTVICMIILVDLGVKGIGKLDKKFHFLEHHERLITGIILILLGTVSFFIKL